MKPVVTLLGLMAIVLYLIAASVAQVPDAQVADPISSDEKWCDVVFSSDDATLVALVDQDGRYLRNVRRITVIMDIGKNVPMANAESWDGPIEPLNKELITVGSWKIRKFEFVASGNFQQIVDSSVMPTVQPLVSQQVPVQTEAAPIAKPTNKPKPVRAN